MKDKVLFIVFNSKTDFAEDIYLEDPNTYWNVALLYKIDSKTEQIFVERVRVETLIKEKELEAIKEANRRQGITSFREFLQNKYGKDSIVLIPNNTGIVIKEQEMTK